ncbi:MAG: alpha/beta hydrolase [Oscillospiraceae bacterium]|nr:alpha/beta hydrolase [Oscillospiraceae bacterium]
MENVTYSEHEIQSGKARVVLSVWEPEEPKAVIVFVPATMIHPLMYKPLLSGFAERGLAVVGLHPVGHGKSPRNIKRYTIKDIVQNGRDAISFAHERYSLPIIAMGSSQGGLVAAAMSIENEKVSAVFSHNVILSELPESVKISRFPNFLRHVHRPTKGIMKFYAKIIPGVKIPIGLYLKYRRVCPNRDFWNMAMADKYNLRSYSVHFLVSLFTTYFSGLTDGGIKCPLYLISASGDGLFSEEYMAKVFELLQAPYKERIKFDCDSHMFMVMNPHEVCEKLANAVLRHCQSLSAL